MQKLREPIAAGTEDDDPVSDAAVGEIVAAGPYGAIAVAGIAVALVFAIWFAFYFLVFLPRGPIG